MRKQKVKVRIVLLVLKVQLQKILLMKRKILLLLFSCLIIFFFVNSCRSDMLQNESGNENAQKRNNADFFKRKVEIDIAGRAGVDYVALLEDYNEETNFVATMPDQQGMPMWDKVQVLDYDNGTKLLIPLSFDNEALSSVLFTHISNENRVLDVNDVTNGILENYVYNANNSVSDREGLFSAFMLVDYATFGNTNFSNLPSDLFTNLKSGETTNNIKFTNLNLSSINYQTSKAWWVVTICLEQWSCKNGKTYKDCDKCSACWIGLGCNTEIQIPQSTGGSGSTAGTGSTGNGGTSGGGGSWGGTFDPCTRSGVFYRVAEGCTGDGNNAEPPQTPCEKTKAIVNKPQIKDSINSYNSFAAVSKKTEKGMQELKTGGILPGTVGNDFQVYFGIGSNSMGTIHVHPLEGIAMFSGKDILNFINLLHQQDSTTLNSAYSGMISSSGNYFINFTGSASDLPPLMTDAQVEAMRIELSKYIEGEASVLFEDSNYYTLNPYKLNEQGNQLLFFKLMEKMGLTNKIALIKEENGETYNITLDSNGATSTKSPCN